MGFKNKLKNFFVLDDDEYEYVESDSEEEDYEQPNQYSSKEEKKQNVVSLKSMQPSSKVVLCEPRTYNEAQEIADNLVNRKAIVINLQRVNHQQAKRIVDFLSGTVYAIGGDIQKLGSQTFLCTPDNVDVSGTISEVMNEHEEDDEYQQRW
ncbi:cell division protein SepF [Pontibacillus yanchengensis]|uniref:Cell division protein SepF n=1 Tax=Pontibacillus yanchengensis Y32 TaxID=1385514 RepID=A0A0A2TEB2_9BACI|nr:cell division protein SepF [Pontibacillus yanchengensis]KGP72416.1 cell division protein SepF [Pontibacillus yanchengensis Y32]